MLIQRVALQPISIKSVLHWWNGSFLVSITNIAFKKWPTTGNTVYYTLDITNGTYNRGGSGEKVCFFINGVSPGPTLYATWGDMVSVTVNNKMQHNETSLHWVSPRSWM